MANYLALTKILLKTSEPIRVFSFDEIESIIEAPISPVYINRRAFKHPNSAFVKYSAKAGFKVLYFDIEQRKIAFEKTNLSTGALIIPEINTQRNSGVIVNDSLGKDLDEAVEHFKNSWSSIGGQYVPFKDKYTKIEDVYFNAGMEAYRAAMKRAISLNGLSQRIRNELRIRSCSYLADRLKELFKMKCMNFDIFTGWAEVTATEIRRIYRGAGVNDYTYGNAQKLINVAIKFVLSSNLVNYHHPIFRDCHFPVDGIIQNVIKKRFGVNKLSICWSKNDNWNDFVDYQRRARERVLEEGYYSPLIWEATHWNN